MALSRFEALKILDRESLEDVGKSLADKATEDLDRIGIADEPDKFFMIGTGVDWAVSVMLLKKELEKQRPMFYVSKAMVDAETQYLPLEKLILALMVAAMKLMHYLQAHTIKGEYAAKNDRMAAYMKTTNSLLIKFDHHELNQITRDQNTHADALACLASAINSEVKRTIEMGFILEPSISLIDSICVNVIDLGPSWMDPITTFLSSEQLPTDKKEAHKLRNKVLRYYLDPHGKLSKMFLSGLYLECVHPDKMEDFLAEKHEGSCGAHSGGRSFAHRPVTQGHYWPTIRTDAKNYVKKCEQCHKFSPLTHLLVEELNSVTSPWPFAQWGLDIVRPLPRALGSKRFLIVVTDYFTKWVEVEPLAHIQDVDVK
ncbi:uncharacterized protein LOC114281927 [Camellia sinensis]|uniref:uncharacterized protein LOC114281927 n=1 Tax=Camellia sinensis TaxID=4442 RepID=UPI00103646A7|nr:uncharacterized protein LOC114281927 [Camellia sinensis]